MWWSPESIENLKLTCSNQIENVDVYSINADFYGNTAQGHSLSYGLNGLITEFDPAASLDLDLDLKTSQITLTEP